MLRKNKKMDSDEDGNRTAGAEGKDEGEGEEGRTSHVPAPPLKIYGVSEPPLGGIIIQNEMSNRQWTMVSNPSNPPELRPNRQSPLSKNNNLYHCCKDADELLEKFRN